MILDFRVATLADADSVADVYLCSRKELVACAPLAHSDQAVREWIRGHLIPAGRTTVAVVDDLVVGLLAVFETVPPVDLGRPARPASGVGRGAASARNPGPRPERAPAACSALHFSMQSAGPVFL